MHCHELVVSDRSDIRTERVNDDRNSRDLAQKTLMNLPETYRALSLMRQQPM